MAFLPPALDPRRPGQRFVLAVPLDRGPSGPAYWQQWEGRARMEGPWGPNVPTGAGLWVRTQTQVGV